jgi:hypothetical protein
MQEALQSAVTRMNNGSGGSAEPKAPFSMDMMGMLMTVIPKLLQGSESTTEMAEKMETQQGDLTSLREQMQILRKQCYRVMKSEEQLLAKVDDIIREQTTIGRAVLDLAQHLARITVIDDAPREDEYRAEMRTNGHDNGRRPRGTPTHHGSTSRAGRLR